MKTIVTHIGPDLDAITSIWLIKTFYPGWQEAALAFVPAGKTLHDTTSDSDPEIIHVDTGFGKLDHHQSDANTCAAKRVYEELIEPIAKNAPLERMIEVVNDIDHFREVFFPNPTADCWNFTLATQIDGWRILYSEDPLKIVALTMDCLDSIYKVFQNRLWAEKEISEKGILFDCPWGRGLAVETVNDEVVHLGQKMGYVLVIRKDTVKGYLRIKALPRDDIDLTSQFKQLKNDEPDATWFLHASRHMILNGSTKNPEFRPSKKSLKEVISLFSL